MCATTLRSVTIMWVNQMGAQRAHIVLPEDLLRDIDAAVGPRGRSAFLVDTARAELRKRQLLKFLNDPEPAWKDEDHPELVALDTEGWVRELRQRGEKRIPGRSETESASE